MSFNFDNYNLDDLTQHQSHLSSIVRELKNKLAALEEELKAGAEKIKELTSNTASVVQDKAEEVAEVVKEEVKKAAPKKSTKKAAAKAEETPVEESTADDSDK